MNKYKNIFEHYKNYLFYFSISFFAALGVYVGYITVDRYTTIVNAALGITVLYLLNQRYLYPRKRIDRLSRKQPKYPEDLKYLPYAFILGVIMLWACIQLIHLLGFG